MRLYVYFLHLHSCSVCVFLDVRFCESVCVFFFLPRGSISVAC